MGNIPSQQQYESNEARLLARQIEYVEKAPKEDRQAAVLEYSKMLREYPDVLIERIGWLLAGNYGYGSYRKAGDIARSPRMNRPAALAQMIAALEWQCPARSAISAWKGLSVAQQKKINGAILRAIKEWEKEHGKE
jgi:hypothetical protein